MRKRSALLVLGVAVVIVAGVLTWVVAGRWGGDPRCPLYVAEALAKSVGVDDPGDPWTVYAFDGAKAGGAPKIEARASSVSPRSERPRSCKLAIASAPQSPGKGADWRIGHAFRNPAAVRGRTVTFRVHMKADRPLEFDSAYIYIWDGLGWATAPFTKVSTDWQAVQAKLRLSPNATAFDVWIRLLFDTGTIRPGDGTLYFVAEVEGEAS